MRLLIIGHPRETPSARHRIVPLLPMLARDGIEAEHVALPAGFLPRWEVFRRARTFDVVLLQKRLLPAWQLRSLRRRARRLIYDFDDPMIYSRDDGVVKTSATRVRRFGAVVKLADMTVAANAALERMAIEHGAAATCVIPTAVELARWAPRNHAGDARTLGWVGTRGNLPLLRGIAPALRGRRVTIVADQAIPIEGARTDFVAWDPETEAREVQSFDIGLAPLADDAWSRCKMPFKILLYFAAGVPVVASPFGEVRSVIRDGVNGLLARTVADWEAAIARLTADAGLRRRLAAAGRRTVESGYTIEPAYAKLKALLA